MEWTPRKVVIWGIGNDYEVILNQIKFEMLKNNLTCEALICRDKDAYAEKKDGFRIVKASDFCNLQFDYLIIASARYYKEIKEEAVRQGIESDRIIDGSVFRLPLFDFRRYVSLIENPVTILSDDCWGGGVYHRLKLPFSSPLINIWWDRDQYWKFIQKPFFYLDTPLQMVREGDLCKGIAPFGKLGKDGDYVELQLIHNYDFAGALEQWNRRVKRINRENLFVKMGFHSAHTEEKKERWIKAFEKVPYKKILFYNGEEDLPEVFKQGNMRYMWKEKNADIVEIFDYNVYCRQNYQWDLDLLKLLVDGQEYSRY